MKTLKMLLAVCLMLCVVFTVAACSHEHEFSTDWKSDADGHWHTCLEEDCAKDSEVVAHTYGAGEVTTPSTEKEAGVMTYECMVCGYQKTEAIAKLPHVHVLTKVDAVEASCTKEGAEAYYTCSVCDLIFSDAEGENAIKAPVAIEKLAHADEDKNHECDVCKSNVGTHVEGEGSHDCDYCGETISVCEDADKDHDCDQCGAEMGAHESEGHICDYCNKPVTECVDDEWPMHKCDICGETVSACEDADNDHYCDLCWETTSTCVDTNEKDHACDICGAKMGIHKPSSGGHTCDYCGYKFTECTPAEDDGDCTTAILCTKCGDVTTPAKEHDLKFFYNDKSGHWTECQNENCNYATDKVAHARASEGKCECGYACEDKCDVCGSCLDESCVFCETKCEFIDTNKVINFVPNANLGAPEGPDGVADGYTNIKDSLVTQQTVLPDGNKALLVTAPNGAAANSGASFLNNSSSTIHPYGKNGYSCGVPLVDGKYTTLRMHFTNTGNSEVSFKFSNIDYYYDYGAAEVTLAAGETKVVLIYTSHGDSVGLNSQIVFTKEAAAGASVAMWGEYVANENLTGISVSVPAGKLNYVVGDTFTAEGLVLKANGTNYSRVYISGNYVTNLDGYVFTKDDIGTKAVIVTFAGKQLFYIVEVADHIHDVKYVPETAPVACEKDGMAAHYVCTVCGEYYTDETGNKIAPAPKTISCHTAGDESKVLPGADVLCSGCDEVVGQRSMENWVLFNITTTTDSIGSDVKNAKVEKIDLNGIPATKVYLGAGTKGGTGNNDIYLKMSSNDGDRQSVIPHLGSKAADGTTRTVMLYYENYGSEPVTMNLQNDRGSANGMCKVTVPANGTAIGSFSTAHKDGGSNWYHYYVDSSHNTDVSFAVYGYMYVNDSEVTNAVSINKAATKLNYKVGESFSSEGLVLQTSIDGSKTIVIRTGYTTDYDGRVFTEGDIGSHTVTVTFAGKTISYTINVVDDIKCDQGIHEYDMVYDEALFVKMNGDDAIYSYACIHCGAVSTETYAAPKISFVPHHNIGGGHTIEYVTLADGRIAAKLTFNSDVAAGTTYTITANSTPAGTNTNFPVRAERRAYLEMTASADVNLTWQPEFYGDRDAFNFDLKAGETGNYSRTILYTGSHTSSALPYQEIVCNSAVKAGTVVYITGYFYAPGDVTGVSINTAANTTVFKVGETFTSDGLTLKPQSNESLYSGVVIYNVNTTLDGYTFKAEDAGKLIEVVVYCGNAKTSYYVAVSE